MKKFVLCVSLTISMLVVISAVEAAPGHAMADWGQLSLEQRSVLEPLHQTWDHLSYMRRQRLLCLVPAYQKMSAVEKQRFSSRLLRWATLTRTERSLTRQQYAKFAKLPDERQVQIKRQWQELQAQREAQSLRVATDAPKVNRN